MLVVSSSSNLGIQEVRPPYTTDPTPSDSVLLRSVIAAVLTDWCAFALSRAAAGDGGAASRRRESEEKRRLLGKQKEEGGEGGNTNP